MPHHVDADKAAQARYRHRYALRERVERAARFAVTIDLIDQHAVEFDDARMAARRVAAAQTDLLTVDADQLGARVAADQRQAQRFAVDP